MMHQDGLQVGIAIVLSRLVMLVIRMERGHFFQPSVNIFDQTFFIVVHVDAGCNVHGRDQSKPILDPAGFYNFFHLGSNVDVGAVLLGIERQIFGVKFHYAFLVYLEAQREIPTGS